MVARGLEDMDQVHLGPEGHGHLADQIHHRIGEHIQINGNQDFSDGLHGCSSVARCLRGLGSKLPAVEGLIPGPRLYAIWRPSPI